MKTLFPKLLVIVLLVVSAGTIVTMEDPEVAEAPDVVLSLPEQVGEWRGESLYFCQNIDCLHSFSERQLAETGVCPDCGGELRAAWSAAEARLLPPDTVLLKKLYTDPSGRMLRVSIVVSGREHVSIHRPQLCLVGQGFQIADDTVTELKRTFRMGLDVRVLRLHLPHAAARAGDSFFYAYWFAGGGRETASDWARIGYAAWDRLVHNRINRWAYIAVFGVRRGDAATVNAAAARFIEELYPMIAQPREAS